MGNYRFIASQTDKSQYILGALDGKPASCRKCVVKVKV